MRILQICNKAPYPTNDGSSIAISNLAEGLIDNGAELHLLTINTKKHFKPDSAISEIYKRKTNYLSVYKNTNTNFFSALLNLFTQQSYFVDRFFFKDFESQLIEKLKNYSFDIIQLEGVFMASYIPTIKAFSNAKIILRSHNVEHKIWERHLENEKNPIKKFYLLLQNHRLKKFESLAFTSVDAIITITDEDKKIISSTYADLKIYTCLTGVNLNHYKPVLNPIHANTVFHFASMDWMPNIEALEWLLNSVWKEVLKVLPNAQLVIAGRNMPEKFKKLNSKNLIVIDEIENSEEFYNTYDVMLVPLLSGSGLRIKLVEGLAYGKAIISTSIGAEGIPYAIGENILIADSVDEFSKSIISVLINSKQKHDLQSSARILAENYFDYKTIAGNLINIYRAL